MPRTEVRIDWTLALACLVALAGCGRDRGERKPAPARDAAEGRLDTSNPCTAKAEQAAPGDPGRILAAVLGEHASFESLAGLLGQRPADVDALLVALFPGLAGKTLVDGGELAAPPPHLGKIDSGFEARPISFPADWAASPFDDLSWQLWFQSLNWINRGVPVDTAAYAVVDWSRNALYVTPPLAFTWSDHAMAMRLRAVTGLVRRYIEESPRLDRGVLLAAAQVAVIQIYALASEGCYARKHNHGLMEDLALLENLGSYQALRDAAALRDLALSRAGAQIAASVRPDGIHIENSPAYQAHYADLVLRVLAASQAGGHDGDPEIRATAGRVIGAIAQMMQPNLTLPQFGDTGNFDRQEELTTLVSTARALGVDARPLDELDWILSRGARGRRPDRLDVVFEIGGYAAFRQAWDASEAATAITAHFRVGHSSRAHYHPDETGIEIYGHGSELILGPGVHGYSANDPFTTYQASPAAHNVLVVDELGAVERKPHALSKVVAHGSEDSLAWIQGTHPNYRALGVGVVRSFAYDRAASFVVIDHVTATGGEHRYAQHFHLHTRLSDVRQAGATVIARTEDKTGPSVTFTSAVPVEIELARAVNRDGRLAGWHFPDKYQEEPSTDVVLRRSDDRAELDLPVLILIGAPGAPPPVPTKVRYAEANGRGEMSWTLGGKAHSMSVPLPP